MPLIDRKLLGLPMKDLPPRNQDCVLWSRESTRTSGEPNYKPAIALKCRWDDVRAQRAGAGGTLYTSAGKVFPDREQVFEGDVMMLGRLVDVTDPENPMANEGAAEVMEVERIPDFDQEEQVLIVYL